MPRITKAPEERRGELIATAQRLFYTKGYERTSVSDIVKAVGVAQGTFYYYFDSKQAILEAVVAELTSQALAQLEAIVDNESLDATQKWKRVMQIGNDWKIERKAELLALTRVMQSDDNVLLVYKRRKQKAQMIAPLFASIIEQGVAEGVFETAYVEETAEIVYAITQAMNESIYDILLNSDRYDHPEALAWRKIAAVQTAVDRLLGAALGSLPIIDEQALAAWFED